MLAGRMIEPGVLRVDDLPTPSPADGELLVEVLRASICGSDGSPNAASSNASGRMPTIKRSPARGGLAGIR